MIGAAFAAFRKAFKKTHIGKVMPKKAVSEAWRNLPDEEREKFFDAAENSKRDGVCADAGAGPKKAARKKSKASGDRGDDPPVLREVRKFEDLNELLHIFGPASMVRVVGSMLTPSGRVKVQHFVRDPVLLKYDGGTNELSIGFGVSAKFMPMERKTAVTRGY